jgi:hypothetical protein
LREWIHLRLKKGQWRRRTRRRLGERGWSERRFGYEKEARRRSGWRLWQCFRPFYRRLWSQECMNRLGSEWFPYFDSEMVVGCLGFSQLGEGSSEVATQWYKFIVSLWQNYKEVFILFYFIFNILIFYLLFVIFWFFILFFLIFWFFIFYL